MGMEIDTGDCVDGWLMFQLFTASLVIISNIGQLSFLLRVPSLTI